MRRYGIAFVGGLTKSSKEQKASNDIILCKHPPEEHPGGVCACLMPVLSSPYQVPVLRGLQSDASSFCSKCITVIGMELFKVFFDWPIFKNEWLEGPPGFPKKDRIILLAAGYVRYHVVLQCTQYLSSYRATLATQASECYYYYYSTF